MTYRRWPVAPYEEMRRTFRWEVQARYNIAAGSRLATTLSKAAANDDEMAIRIDPVWMTSWDFSARMADAFSPT